MDLNNITLELLEENPYPIYKYLRENHPIVSMPGIGGEWFVTTWDDCATVGDLTGTSALAGGHPFEFEFFGGDSILTMNDEHHKQLRAGIDVVLRPKHVHSFMDDFASDVVREYVAKIKPLGKADLVKDLFEPISVRVVGNRLGLGEKDDATLREWFKTLSGGLSHHNIDDEAAAQRADEAKSEIDEYLRNKIDILRENPDGSLLSHMLVSGLQEGATPRTFEDVMPSVRVIILGGFQEPGSAISNTFLGLLTNPDQLSDVTREPEKLSSTALQEGMRWIAPIGTVERTVLEDVQIRDVTIPAGSLVTLVMASANHDEARFKDGDLFNIHREGLSPTVFGYGSHYCAGNFLAKSLGTAVIEEVVRELTNLRLVAGADPQVRGHLFQSVQSLESEWDN